MFHLFGFAIGLGTATVADVLFFKFLKDFKISKFEAGVMRTLSKIVWFALIIIFISGLGFYLRQPSDFVSSGKFLTKLIVLVVIVVNVLFFNIFLFPKLKDISFDQGVYRQKKFIRLRKFAYASGAVSLASWYYASALSVAKNPTLGFLGLILVYLFMLGAAILICQVFERANFGKETEKLDLK